MSGDLVALSLAGRRVVFADLRSEGLDLVPEHEAYATRVANSLIDVGARVMVLCSSPMSWTGLRQGTPLVSLQRGGAVARCLSLLGERIDIVIDVEASSPWIAGIAARAGATPIVLLQHEQLRPNRAGLRGVLRQAVVRHVHRESCVLVTAGSLRRAARKDFGLRGPVRVIPPGSATFSSAPRSRGSRPTVVCLASPTAGSQVDRLLRAVPTVIGEFPELRVEILGDGVEREALEHLAYGLGVESAVHFAGRMPPRHQQELLASAWLAVDPLGSAPAIEAALSVGIPVVAEARGSTVDLVREGMTGWLVQSEHDFGNRLLSALKSVADPAEAVAISERCRRAGRAPPWADCAAQFVSVVSSEVRRAELPQRRRWSDVTALAGWSSESPPRTIEVLEQRLRCTDRWSADGDHFQVLLHDCDEVDATRVLADLHVPEAELRIAGRDDLAFLGAART